MNIIGDIHGDWQRYFHICKSLPDGSIQIGDHGQGFKNDATYCDESLLKRNHLFFQGNHDSPEQCRQQANFLGSVGYRAPVFWIGGGFSIDKCLRRPGISWWEDEQLTEAQRKYALELYEVIKPKFVLSHDAPTMAARAVLEPLLTREALIGGANPGYVQAKLAGVGQSVLSAVMQQMLEIHAPERWYFGHFHTSKNFMLSGYRTQFTCVNIMEVVQAPFEFENESFLAIAPDGTPYGRDAQPEI